MTGTDVPRWRPSRPGGPGSPAKQHHNRNSKLPIRAGLSPRVRRYPKLEPKSDLSIRSISACAEVPETGKVYSRRQGVYLRVCGGTVRKCCLLILVSGLSPRVRRYPEMGDAEREYKRSISACAEVPCQRRRTFRRSWVYLRVCGGTQRPFGCRFRGLGLSPRVRRYPGLWPSFRTSKRSISACAEVPPHPALSRESIKVYLRVCGGTLGFGCRRRRKTGLSPRVRRYPLRYSVRQGHQSAGKRTACLEKCNRYWAGRPTHAGTDP